MAIKLLVGLGNPHPELERSRHNLGFMVIDLLAERLRASKFQRKFNGLYCFVTDQLVLLKPQTSMNKSGVCVKTFLKFFEIELENLVVIYDELNMPLEKFSFRLRGSSGGHNGMLDIINSLKTQNIRRLRIGVGYNPQIPRQKWVLESFSSEEWDKINKSLETILVALEEWSKEKKDFLKLMNAYNKKKVSA